MQRAANRAGMDPVPFWIRLEQHICMIVPARGGQTSY